MELSGLFLVSDELDLEGVENGSYDYRHLWLVLRAVSDQAAAPISRGNAQVNIAILSGGLSPCRPISPTRSAIVSPSRKTCLDSS